MFSIITQNYSAILDGIGTTLFLLIISLLAGLILSVTFAAIKYYRIPVLKQAVDTFVFFIRGTPFLVQLFLIYYGPFQFHWMTHSWLGIPFKSATFCALLALIFNTTAYTSSLFYGAMRNLPQDEVTAGTALGLSNWQNYVYIILPRYFVRILPVYKNEVIMLLKCTSLVSTITILDVMGVMRQIMTQTYQTIPSLLIAGIIYLVLAVALNAVMKFFYSKKLHKVKNALLSHVHQISLLFLHY